MRQHQYAAIVLFALIITSSLTSFGCYSCMSRLVNDDMNRALALTMQEQQSDIITPDTIHSFNNHLQIAELRGKATLAVDARGKRLRAYARCSEATILKLSNQRPAILLWTMSFIWAIFVWYKRHNSKVKIQTLSLEQNDYGGLILSEAEGQFYSVDGRKVNLTPMQYQLMKMFFHSPTHSLTKKEICDALWPKKPDASDTLYTLIRRLKSVIEQCSYLKIESNRGKAYHLEIN